MARIEPQRIGTGIGFFVCGGIAGLIGAWGLLARDQVGMVWLAAAAGLIGVGFWIRLFGLVERRLMDIEAALVPGATISTDANAKGGKDPLGVDHLF